ncbi:ABC transporter substrate-binding protein [Paraburkholderia fungorum]|uniref:ABC transporter substrate-binding protein n=1 Tax=Paraburkholderia fungorum TaxID=134537 RepID=UPI0020979AA5|nr:ABC transporter substrate-binding protein [Paraburkholderia fungorum]USX06829.1 ABC transporter substrate-binding protein [Paraburkholderia fungorum]
MHYVKRFAALAAVAMASALSVAQAQEVIKVGISAPMSGAAANWGLGMDWAAKAAADEINAAGGVTVGGKKYKFEVISYDNKYNAADGIKVAQTLISRDKVRYIIGAIGTAPVLAMQPLADRTNVLMFQSAWGKSLKGDSHPLTFTTSNSPYEILRPLYSNIKAQHPGIKTVAFLNPNDATGKEMLPEAKAVWESLGVKVISENWYERGTTQFQPVAAKLAAAKPDVIDLGVTPPADAGVVFKELAVLGTSSVKVVPVATNAEQMVQIGGKAVDDVYMGFSGDYGGKLASAKQRSLNQGMKKAIGEALNPLQLSSYDGLYALKAGIEAAQSLDSKEVAKALPKIVFDTSYGKTAFGGATTYGTAQQLLIPVILTQIKAGKLVELARTVPDELKQRLR